MANLKLTVLDQSPIHDNQEERFGLLDTIELAKKCEEFGYHRYWCAEHHDTPGYASAAPEIMVGAVASATSKIRVGSGGVMLNHYSPYKVAEVFNTLSALHGNRIDLGIGRANGANFLSARALHNQSNGKYSQKAYDVISYLNGTLDEDDYFYGVGLSPKGVEPTPVYLLGSSEGSSALAGDLGAGFCLALFIGIHERPTDIIEEYKRNFKPSKKFKEPKAMIAVACICADSTEEAQKIASSHTLWKVQAFRHALREPLHSSNEALKLYEDLSEDDKLYYQETLDSMVLGTPKECKEQIEKLADMYGVDEVVVVNVTYSFSDRVKSYELLAKEFNL